MKYDLTNSQNIQELISEITKSEEKYKKVDAFDAYNVFNGNQLPYIQREMQNRRPDSWKNFAIPNISLSKLVVEKISEAYNMKPIRTLGDDADANERLDAVYSEADSAKNMPAFDCFYNLHRESLMYVNWIPTLDFQGNAIKGQGRYYFMPLQPYEYSIVKDKNDGKPLVVILSYPDTSITYNAKKINDGTIAASQGQGDGQADLISESQNDSSASKKTYVMWSNDQHVIIEVSKEVVKVNGGSQVVENITYVDIPNNPNNINPYGILPFVYRSKDVSPDNPIRNPITDQSISYCCQLAESLTASSWQGTGQLVIKYPSSMQDQMDDIATGMHTAVELPQLENPDKPETDANFINTGADLSGILSIANDYRDKILSEHLGASADTLEGGDYSSGLDRLIANADVTKQVQKNQTTYVEVEKEMFEIIKAIDSANGTKLFSEDQQLSVIFQKPKVHISDGETLDNIKKAYEMGLISRKQALKQIDPNLTDEEAQIQLEEIDAERMGNVARLFEDADKKRESNKDIEPEFEGNSEG
jgi:hypothetical protein